MIIQKDRGMINISNVDSRCFIVDMEEIILYLG